MKIDSEKRHALVGRGRLWKLKREFQIKFLIQAGLKPEHLLLDIGCGTLRGGIPIIEFLNTGCYYGIEARERVLEEGRKEVHDAGCEEKLPTLVASADFGSVKFDERFDLVWAFSVLVHMKDEILSDCLRFVAEHLKEDGRFFANVHYGNQPDGHWQGFPVVSRDPSFFRRESDDAGLKVTDLGPIRNFGHATGIGRQDNQIMLEFSHKK